MIAHGHEVGAAVPGVHALAEAGEGLLGDDGVEAGREEGAGQQVDEIGGSVAQHDLRRLQLVAAGQGLAQGHPGTVRIAVNLGEHGVGGGQGRGRGAERVLVGSELDHPPQPQLALDLFDGLARLVALEPLEMRRAREDQGLHARGPRPAARPAGSGRLAVAPAEVNGLPLGPDGPGRCGRVPRARSCRAATGRTSDRPTGGRRVGRSVDPQREDGRPGDERRGHGRMGAAPPGGGRPPTRGCAPPAAGGRGTRRA